MTYILSVCVGGSKVTSPDEWNLESSGYGELAARVSSTDPAETNAEGCKLWEDSESKTECVEVDTSGECGRA